MNKILNNVRKELSFITWIYEYLAANINIVEVDGKSLLNEFIGSIWSMSIEERDTYFENYLAKKLKLHYEYVFYRELARAQEYIEIENKKKEVQNG